MQGTVLSRSARALGQLVTHPRHAAYWFRDRLTRRSPIALSLPWISWPCIDMLDRLDLRGRRVFEYGGGGSTLYFLSRGCLVRTVDNSALWAERVKQAAARFAPRLDLQVVEMPENPEGDEQRLAGAYVDQILEGSPWDIILVDGVDGIPSVRMQCLAAARQALAPGGLVILDDSWRPVYDGAPAIMAGLRRTRFQGLGPARIGVTRTDVYTAVSG